MIILDTNVISEITRDDANKSVKQFVGFLSKRRTGITAVSVGEIRAGLSRMPEGSRKRLLGERFGAVLDEVFRGRVIPFDLAATRYYGTIVAKRFGAGMPVDKADAQIAAICAARGATLATRNIKDFEGTGVELINPWET